MFVFCPCNRGSISWFLSQITLMISAAILLAAISSLTFMDEWKRKAELEEMASEIAAYIENMELERVQTCIAYELPYKEYKYNVLISSETVIIEIENKRMARENLLIKPYVRLHDMEWKNSEELYSLLKNEYGYSGKINEPIPTELKDNVIEYLEYEMMKISHFLAKHPLKVSGNEEIFIEKACIYFERGKKDIVIIYKNENR